MHSPSREVTTTPLQQLFVMNSAFMQNQAAALASSVEKRAGRRDARAGDVSSRCSAAIRTKRN